MLLDCGPDSLGFLRKEINPRNLDAIVLSHLHADHTLDLVSLRYLLQYGPPDGDERFPRERQIPLYVPPGGRAFLRDLGNAFEGDGGADFWTPFALRDYEPHGSIDIGSLHVQCTPTKHYIPCNAMRITPVGTTAPALVYGADSAPVESLVALARGADTLILEATLPEPENPPMGHMTPRQAGELAQGAGGVRHLVLTHYWGNMPPEQMAADARAVFDGMVSVATEGVIYRLLA